MEKKEENLKQCLSYYCEKILEQEDEYAGMVNLVGQMTLIIERLVLTDPMDGDLIEALSLATRGYDALDRFLTNKEKEKRNDKTIEFLFM
jgi:hypothetical protein